MKTIVLLYKNGDIKQYITPEDLYESLKDDYVNDNYIAEAEAYIFFSIDEFLNKLEEAEDNKLF